MNEQPVTSDPCQINEQISWSRRFYRLTFLLVVARIFLAVFLDLTPDETYYWQLSCNPDFSYYDHPPMVAWLIAMLRLFFGESQLSIRILSVFTAAVSGLILFIIARDWLKSPKVGFWAAVIVNFTPAGVALGFITTPDTPLALAWSVGMLCFLKAINDERDRWWIATGIALGFGALSKYNMIFFVPGVAVTILAFKRYRHLVFTRRYWLMVILAAVGTLPVIYWNMMHEWISFKFQFAHGLNPSSRPMLHNIGEFLGGQLGTVGLTLFPVLWLVVAASSISAYKKDDETRFFLAWLALPTMAFFAYTGVRSKVEANWPQIAYLSAMLLAAEWVCAAESKRRIYWVVVPSALVALIAVFQSLTLALPLPAKSDVSLRMHGWRQMGEILQQIDRETGKKSVFVVQGGTLATLVSYYGKIESPRTAELYASGNFKIWWKNRRLEPGSDVIFVDEDRFSEAPNQAKKFASASFSSYDIVANGKKIRKINVTRMNNLLEPFYFIHPDVNRR